MEVYQSSIFHRVTDSYGLLVDLLSACKKK